MRDHDAVAELERGHVVGEERGAARGQLKRHRRLARAARAHQQQSTPVDTRPRSRAAARSRAASEASGSGCAIRKRCQIQGGSSFGAHAILRPVRRDLKRAVVGVVEPVVAAAPVLMVNEPARKRLLGEHAPLAVSRLASAPALVRMSATCGRPWLGRLALGQPGAPGTRPRARGRRPRRASRLRACPRGPETALATTAEHVAQDHTGGRHRGADSQRPPMPA